MRNYFDNKAFPFIFFLCTITWSALSTGCKSPDKLIGDSNVFNDTNDIPDDPVEEPASVASLLSSSPEDGTVVSLLSLVVISPSSDDGFFASDQTQGPNSGIWIQADFENKGVFDVEIGNIVDIEGLFYELIDDSEAQYGSDSSLSSIVVNNPGLVRVTEQGDDSYVVPLEFDTSLLSNPSEVEKYEGSLVKIENPTLEMSVDHMSIDGVLPIGEDFISMSYDSIPTLSAIYGVLGYVNGHYTLYPRHEIDFEYSLNESSEIGPNEFFITEVFQTSTSPVNCSSQLIWYIEMKYAPENSLSMLLENLYLVTEFQNNGGFEVSKIEGSNEIVNDGDHIILTNSGSENCMVTTEGVAVRSIGLTSIDGFSFVNTLEGTRYIKIIRSETEDDLDSNDITSLDVVEPQSYTSDGISRELISTSTGLTNDNISDSTVWCDSINDLVNSSNETLNNVLGLPLQGSPGSSGFHCVGPDQSE